MLPEISGFYWLIQSRNAELVKVILSKQTDKSVVYFIGDERKYKLKSFKESIWIGPIQVPKKEIGLALEKARLEQQQNVELARKA